MASLLIPPTSRLTSLPRDPRHLFALAGFAVAEPLFAVLAENAPFFTIRRSAPVDVVLFAAAVALLVPLVLVAVESLVWRANRRAGALFRLTLIAVLGAVAALPPFKKVGLPGWPTIGLAALFGVALAVAYARHAGVRVVFTVLAPAPLVFVALFLLAAPIRRILAPAADPAASNVVVRHPAPVVLVVFDEFNVLALMNERREIDAVRFPSFARLASRSTWFRNATTVNENSEVAVPAILTGRYPDRERLPTAGDHPHNLFTLLGGTYEMQVFETLTQLCPPSLCAERSRTPFLGERLASLASDATVVYLHILSPTDLADGLPSIAGRWGDFLASPATVTASPKPPNATRPALVNPKGLIGQALREDRPQRFQDFLASLRAGARPALYFVHSLLPHASWRYLPSGRDYSTVGDELLMEGWFRPTEDWTGEDWTVIQGYQRYLLQVGFVDRLIGQMLDRLEAEGILDQALIIVTADHGVSFVPHHSRRGIDDETYADILSVPLFVKAPGQQRPEVSDRNVETIDVLPIAADLLGVDLPFPVDGRRASDVEPGEKVAIITREKPAKRLTFDAKLPARDQRLSNQLSLFGSGSVDGVFRLGPHPELLGREVSAAAAPSSVSVRIGNPGLYEDVDPSGDFLPIMVAGDVIAPPDLPRPFPLAIAVNGVIRATTKSIQTSKGETRFSALVPESALVRGRNEIEAYLVVPAADGLALERCTPRTYRLARRAGTEVLIAPTGEAVPIRAGAVQGRVDLRLRRNGRRTVLGWAADGEHAETAALVVAFVDGRPAVSVAPGSASPEAARRNPALRMSGFGFDLPVTRAPLERLRVFGISRNGAASELPLTGAGARAKRSAPR